MARFASEAGPRDRIAIETIADDSRWDVNWGDSREQIRGAIEKLANRGKLTRLWDGLLEAAGKFPEDPTARRAIVISDGHDEGSMHALEEVIAAYQQRLIPVDAIGMTRSDKVYLANLQRLADGTGGQFRDAANEADLEKLVGSGIERLRSMPVVSFRADDLAGDGKTHQFEFLWKHDNAESAAKVSVKVPVSEKAPLSSRRPMWLWLAVLAAVALAAAGIGMSRRRTVPPPAPAAAPAAEPPRVHKPSATAIQAAPKPAAAAIASVAAREYAPPQPRAAASPGCGSGRTAVPPAHTICGQLSGTEQRAAGRLAVRRRGFRGGAVVCRKCRRVLDRGSGKQSPADHQRPHRLGKSCLHRIRARGSGNIRPRFDQWNEGE